MTESLTSHSLFNQLQSDLLLLPLYCNHVSKKSPLSPCQIQWPLFCPHFASRAWPLPPGKACPSLLLQHRFPGFLVTSLLPLSDLLWLLLLSWTSQFWGFLSLGHCLLSILPLSFSFFPPSLLSTLWPFQNISPTQSSPPSSTHRFSWLPDTWVSNSSIKLSVKVLVVQLCPILCDPVDWACQTPLSMEFSRQYWNGLPFPSPGVLPNPGIELRSLALQVDYSPFEIPGKPTAYPEHIQNKCHSPIPLLTTQPLSFPTSVNGISNHSDSPPRNLGVIFHSFLSLTPISVFSLERDQLIPILTKTLHFIFPDPGP